MAQTATAFHAYVDSIYGDNAQATALNPSPLGSAGRPMQQHPGYPTSNYPGFLQHAPYSFRTVTGCLAWFKANWPADLQGRRLPWTNPQTQKQVEYLVIHCMPGLYGPDVSPAVDAESGLPWNGESFPLELPQRVSIQGTSALDTIFDARRTNTSIFSIQWPGPPEDGHAFEYTFIDGITIRGARGIGEGSPRQGAGVLIDSEHPVRATISNCFITDNVVGIAVITNVDDWYHEPIIVNNTIAWNQIGLYNWSMVTGLGDNFLRVLNNVFDSSVPAGLPPGHVVGVSCFEGVDVNDRTCSKNMGTNFDFNAYEVIADPAMTRTNIGDITSAVPYSWPRTQTRTPPQTSYQPRVQIQDYTKPPLLYTLYSTERQVLYINDVFRKDPGLPMICRHDFRLSPTARRKIGETESSVFNPLINKGVDFGLLAGKPVHTGFILFQNGLTITYSPGLPPPGTGNAEPMAALNCWDYDADGFGNQRVAGRNYAAVPVPPEGIVDLGADESHEATISGFVESTRTFSRPHAAIAANSSGIGTRDAVYLFNVNGQQGNVYIRPQFNFSPDLVYSSPHARLAGSQWYNQAATNPYDGQSSNYTTGKFDDRSVPTFAPNQRRLLTTFVPVVLRQPLFMRNLACDIAPHLLHDIKPDLTAFNNWYQWWGERNRFVNAPAYVPYALYEDIFKSNPWYNSTTSLPWTWDNDFLYFDPADSKKWNQAGHINPCLVVLDSHLGSNTKRMLFSNGLHPILLWEWGPLTFLYTINNYGRIVSGPLPTGADPVPFINAWHGLRISCELLDPDNSYWPTAGVPLNNVQTFLVVQGPGDGVPQIDSDGSVPPEQEVQSLSADTERQQLMRAKLDELRRARR